MVHIVAKAKSIVTCSSLAGPLCPPRCKAIILLPSINSFVALISIEQTMSGPGLSMVSVKCLSKMEAPNATAPKHA